MNVDAYLEPVSDDDAIGPDSFDLPERQAVTEIFEREGEEITARDWLEAVRTLEALAGQTRDLWVAVKLAEAGAQAGDLGVVVDGTALLAGLLETFWDDVHPKLEDYDFEGRANTLASLTKIRDFLGPLQRVTLIETRLGSYSGEDLERFAKEGDGAEGYGMFRASLDQLRANGVLESTMQEIIDRLDAIRDAIRRSDRVLTDNAGSETSTNFQPTYETIEAIRRSVAPYAGIEVPAEADDAGESGGVSEMSAGGGPRIGGRVDSRQDVLKALDAICDYYRMREPTSPVPVLLVRAKQWVEMDFLTLIADLVPDSTEEAKRILMSMKDRQEAESDY